MLSLKNSSLNFVLRLTLGLCLFEKPLLGETPVLSDGSAVRLETAQMSITPPVGWEVLLNNRGKALIMQVPASKEPIKDYSKPIYARNVTIAVTHEALPIDPTQALALRAKLEKELGSAPGLSNFQIVEHRFIDYRDKADAILVYTAFEYNGFPMSQMHILVSGSTNSALLSYTDLADEFQKNEAAMTQAWNSMLSIEVIGKAPKRYAHLIPAGVAIIITLLCSVTLLIFRRRKARRFIDAEEDNLYSDDSPRTSRRSKSESSVSAISAPAYTVSDVWPMKSELKAKRRSSPKQAAATSSQVSCLY